MTEQFPTFSIIIPCFNQDKYLEECLNSVSNQTFQNWECIVVNDGSTDKPQLNAIDFVKKIIDLFTNKKNITFFFNLKKF